MAINILTPQWHRLSAGTHTDGGGLSLVNEPPRKGGKSMTKTWVWRRTVNGKRVPIKLGSALKVPLKVAREHRDILNEAMAEGRDPRVVWTEFKNPAPTVDFRLDTIAGDFFAAKWAVVDRSSGDDRKIRKNEKNAQRWFAGIQKEVLPVLGDRLIYEITPKELEGVFQPYMARSFDMAEKTADRLMQLYDRARRLDTKREHNIHREIVQNMKLDLKFAEVKKQRAAKKASSQSQTGMVAVPYAKMPDTFAKLGDDTVENAIRFLVLTAQRVGSLGFAQWSEFDWDQKEWQIPYDQLKRPELGDLVVPLSDEAMAALDALWRCNGGHKYVLHSEQARVEGVINSQTLVNRLEALGISDEEGNDAHTHGFRGSFRTWAQEQRVGDYAEREWCLHHKFWKSETELAYLKGNRARMMLDARRDMLNLWGRFVTGQLTLDEIRDPNRIDKQKAQVIPFHRAG